MQCNETFDLCAHSNRIKFILKAYNKIVSDKHIQLDNYKTLQQDIEVSDTPNSPIEKWFDETIHFVFGALKNENVIDNLSSDTTYSNVQLLNDFYHIKYNHNVNDNPAQFNLFYQYLLNNDGVSKCDISHCSSVKRHYNRRNPGKGTPGTRSTDLVCRIHTYFMHSSQLTLEEIHSIENKLNELELKEDETDMLHHKKMELLLETINNKRTDVLPSNRGYMYTLSENQRINYDRISNLLDDHKVNVYGINLANTFDKYGYHTQQLIDDLCTIKLNKNDENMLLSDIFDELNVKDPMEKENIYDLILFKYFDKSDLNNNNFIKILQSTVRSLYPEIDSTKFVTIARNERLNANIFNKGTSEFKNSSSFSKIFKSIPNWWWDREKYQKIYLAIKRWTPITDNLNVCDETKSVEREINHTEADTESDIINQFCAIANATRDVAIQFLKETEWNITFAVDKYYATNGSISSNEIYEKSLSNNHGILFWYWHTQQENKRFVCKKYDNLKDEILQFKQFTLRKWNVFTDECDILLKTDKIKSISSNGNNVELYGLQKGSMMSNHHIYSILLYTDCTWFRNVFCDAFMLRKISNTKYERIESVQKRNEKVANCAKLLIEAVECYGKFLTNNKRKYYIGISMEFILKTFITTFNVPISFTTEFINATKFTEPGNGLILELKRHNEFLSGLDCSALSAFDHEKEILFFGTGAILEMCCLYQIYDNKWKSYRRYIQGIQSILDVANGTIKWNRVNNIKELIEIILPHLYSDSETLPPYIKSLLNYHLQYLPNRIEYDFREISHQYEWVRNIFMKQTNVPNVSNACNLFKQCNYITFIMPNDLKMDSDCCESIVEDMLKIVNHDVTIEFKWEFPKSLHNIQLSFQKFASETINLNTNINIISNSITITHSVSEHYLEKSNDILESNKVKASGFRKLSYGHELLIFGFVRNIKVQAGCRFIIPPEILSICMLYFVTSAYTLPERPWMGGLSPSKFYLKISKFMKKLPKKSREHIWEDSVRTKLPDGRKTVLNKTNTKRHVDRLIGDLIIVYCKIKNREKTRLKRKEVDPYIQNMVEYIYDTHPAIEQDKFENDITYFSNIIKNCVKNQDQQWQILNYKPQTLENKGAESDINSQDWLKEVIDQYEPIFGNRKPRQERNHVTFDNIAVCGCGANKVQDCVIL